MNLQSRKIARGVSVKIQGRIPNGLPGGIIPKKGKYPFRNPTRNQLAISNEISEKIQGVFLNQSP